MSEKNLLHKDGKALYYGKILDTEQSQYYFDKLLSSIEWKNDEVLIFGKKITTKRKTAWYADKNYCYTYSHTSKLALPWTEELRLIKNLVELISKEKYNACLLNLYHNGSEGMAWHSDNEKTLLPKAPIASLSLGAERKFMFKHKITQEKAEILLENGSLLVMKEQTQNYWLHQIPISKKIQKPRINLTFRTMLEESLQN